MKIEVPKFPKMNAGGIIDSYTKEQADEKFQEKLSEEQLENISAVPNKQDKLSEEQLKNISDVPKKADRDVVSNALKGSASGQYVIIDDISPIEHTMGVKVRNKNLFDKNNYNVGYRVKNTDGTLSQSTTGYGSTDYIPVEGGKTYTISGYVTDDSTTRHIAYYDSNKVFISGGNATNVFTAPQNACYVRKSLHNDDVDTYQLEEGTEATEYSGHVDDLSAVTVKKYGANILPYPYTGGAVDSGITWTDNGDGTITANGTATANSYFRLNTEYELKEGVPYRLTGCPLGGGFSAYRIYAQSNFDGATNMADNGEGATYIGEGHTSRIIIQIYNGVTVNNLTFKPMLSVGESNVYEPYKEPTTHTPSAEGTVEGVTSVYPTTTLLPDTAGVIVDCEYNRDINKAFAELTNAIISLGGNV